MWLCCRRCLLSAVLTGSDLVAAGTELAGAKYWTRSEAKFKPDYVIEDLVARNQYFCIGKCDRTTGCVSVSWKPGEKLCLLSSIDQTHDHWKNPLPSELEAATGWKTYSRIVVPVFHVLGSNGRYTMTFLDAEVACQQRGGYLATPGDLLTARKIGLNMCNCGWLSDKSIGFVLQHINYGCLNWFTDGIFDCHWLNTADAWCRFA